MQCVWMAGTLSIGGQMILRDSINNLIRTDKPESASRTIAIFFGINTPGWIWYAIIYDKMPALLLCLAQVLAFIALILGVKQVTEKKGSQDANLTDTTV